MIREKEKFFRKISLLIAAVFVLHFLALEFHLYWSVWWYDMPVHFIGGMFVSLLFLWFRGFSGARETSGEFVGKNSVSFLKIFVVVLAVGIGWEIFEYSTGFSRMSSGYWGNSFTDILMDILGGSAGFLFFQKSYKKILAAKAVK